MNNPSLLPNRNVDEVRRLRKREHRLRTGLTIVEGYPELELAVKAGVPIRTLYICREIIDPQPGEIPAEETIEVSLEDFKQIAFGAHLKGILAVSRPQHYHLNELKLSQRPLVVVLEKIEKPGNIGAAIRSCDGAGGDAVILCEELTDVYNHNTVHSSMGTVFTVPTVAASNKETLTFLRSHKIKIYIASNHAAHAYTECDFSRPCALVIGNEHCGLSEYWFEHADEILQIPMQGQVSCLNAACSVSILAYEALRQRSL